MDRSAIGPRVVEFFAREFAPMEVARSTAINLDLGIDGLDADYLLTEFAERFEVDLAELEFDRYFAGEACCTPGQLVAVVKSWFSGRFRNPLGLEPLTIGDLIVAAETGKWVRRTGAYPVKPKRDAS